MTTGDVFPEGTSADVSETDEYQALDSGEIHLAELIIQANTRPCLCEQQSYESPEAGKIVMDVGH
jgi:hypothetical protein